MVFVLFCFFVIVRPFLYFVFRFARVGSGRGSGRGILNASNVGRSNRPRPETQLRSASWHDGGAGVGTKRDPIPRKFYTPPRADARFVAEKNFSGFCSIAPKAETPSQKYASARNKEVRFCGFGFRLISNVINEYSV